MIRLLLSLTFFFISCSSFQGKFDPETYISQLTLEEKISMIHGNTFFTTPAVERLGIPGLSMSDGPCGVRYENLPDKWGSAEWSNDAVTYFPSLTALAASWNLDLAAKFGQVYGEEAVIRGKNIVLMPGINILRTPLNGRNWEYMSEDPCLVSQLVVPIVKKIQAQNTAVCVKHYALNNQEHMRGFINVEVSERALREIYLPGFKAAANAGALSFMGAYNKFRGQHCSYNEYLVNQVLKKEWGFKGVVMSDWNATHNTKEAALNGLDLEMGTLMEKCFMAKPLLEMVKSGEIEERYVDEKVSRLLWLMNEIDLFNAPEYDTLGMGKALGAPHRHAAAREIAEEGIVLLKNKKSFLPINKTEIKTIAVIGDNATRKHALGGGSTTIKAKYEIPPLEGIKKFVGDDIQVEYAPGYTYDTTKRWLNKESLNHYEPQLMEEAVVLAEKADMVIFVGGFSHMFGLDCEGGDKKSIQLPFQQDRIIKRLAEINDNLVVVMLTGSGFDMTNWIDDIHSLVWMSYSGGETGTALANVLFGKVNPSGKLPMTFPKQLSDSPEQVLGEYPGEKGTVHYNEGIYVGYRYYDKYNVEPQYPFGFGLSYTAFAYDGLKVKSKSNGDMRVEFKIQNTGSVAGKEIAQVYIANMNPEVESPVKELRGFKKVELKPGETKTIRLAISNESIKYFNEKEMQWKFQPGEYQVLVGSSSKDIHLKESVNLN